MPAPSLPYGSAGPVVGARGGWHRAAPGPGHPHPLWLLLHADDGIALAGGPNFAGTLLRLPYRRRSRGGLGRIRFAATVLEGIRP